jgi:hypothetical protein
MQTDNPAACRNSLCLRDPEGLADEDLLLQTGATRLNGDQLKAHASGSWEVSPDGNLCQQLPRWERRCHFHIL